MTPGAHGRAGVVVFFDARRLGGRVAARRVASVAAHGYMAGAGAMGGRTT